jgi:CheY-like chemotaxis protein
VFRVQDTGHGIESENIKKIFEPYYSKKTMQGSRGSGLGLSVVYGILQDHGGYYDVFSEVGKGTEFVLYFPITAESQEFKDISEVLPEGDETILVVDDDDSQRALIQQVLSTFGYEVTTAKNGTEAVKLIKSQSFHLVVLDMIMEPGFDGLDTYKRILELSPGQKAILVSGFSATSRLEEALKLGVGQLVKKPFELKLLATAVRSELDKQEAGVTVRSLPIIESH